MDLSLWFTPGVLITLVSAIVGLIVKAVRLQTKVDALSNDAVERDKTIAAQGALLEAHRTNGDIHFNQEVARQIEKRYEEKFQMIIDDLDEIKELVREIGK